MLPQAEHKETDTAVFQTYFWVCFCYTCVEWRYNIFVILYILRSDVMLSNQKWKSTVTVIVPMWTNHYIRETYVTESGFINVNGRDNIKCLEGEFGFQCSTAGSLVAVPCWNIHPNPGGKENFPTGCWINRAACRTGGSALRVAKISEVCASAPPRASAIYP